MDSIAYTRMLAAILLPAALDLLQGGTGDGHRGLVLLVSILAISLVETLRLRVRAPVDSAVVLGAIVVVVISGLTGPMLDAYPFNVLFWGLLGGLASLRGREAFV